MSDRYAQSGPDGWAALGTVHVHAMQTSAPAPAPSLTALLPKYTERQVAEMLNISVRTVQSWRATPHLGPEYVKIGEKVRYSEQSLLNYVQTRTVPRG